MDEITERRKIRNTSFTEENEKEAFRRSKITSRSPPQGQAFTSKNMKDILKEIRGMRLEINNKIDSNSNAIEEMKNQFKNLKAERADENKGRIKRKGDNMGEGEKGFHK
ncbi:hypothetical protein QE152_g7995 [Popillia japonica]|uniref:Uncharacterized protein n=1 Tax=Popillia japonica TaxID=7064 RepID=A0AAW1M655_POPJA